MKKERREGGKEKGVRTRIKTDRRLKEGGREGGGKEGQARGREGERRERRTSKREGGREEGKKDKQEGGREGGGKEGQASPTTLFTFVIEPPLFLPCEVGRHHRHQHPLLLLDQSHRSYLHFAC